MLLGYDTLLPEEIEHTSYDLDFNYENAIEHYINNMLQIFEHESKRSPEAVQRSREYFSESTSRRLFCINLLLRMQC